MQGGRICISEDRSTHFTTSFPSLSHSFPESILPYRAKLPPPRYSRFMIPHRSPTMEYTSSDTIRDTLYRTEL